jgi:hypothetical protein
MRANRLSVLTVILAVTALAGCAAETGEAPDAGPPAGEEAAAPNEVTVIGLDYAFGGPRTLPPGPTVIAFENQGEVPHEMILVRLMEGVTFEEVMAAGESGGDPMSMMEGGPGILIAGPGETTPSRLMIDLRPGTYMLVCNFQDEDDAPPHIALGMSATLEVSGS